MKLINRIKCFFGWHKWGVGMSFKPGEGSDVHRTTLKYCMCCPFIHSITSEPLELQGEQIQMVVWEELADVAELPEPGGYMSYDEFDEKMKLNRDE